MNLNRIGLRSCSGNEVILCKLFTLTLTVETSGRLKLQYTLLYAYGRLRAPTQIQLRLSAFHPFGVDK